VPNTNARWPIKRSKDTEFCVVFLKKRKNCLLGLGTMAKRRGPKGLNLLLLWCYSQDTKIESSSSF